MAGFFEEMAKRRKKFQEAGEEGAKKIEWQKEEGREGSFDPKRQKSRKKAYGKLYKGE